MFCCGVGMILLVGLINASTVGSELMIVLIVVYIVWWNDDSDCLITDAASMNRLRCLWRWRMN